MPWTKARKRGNPLRKTEGEWEWQKKYRIWDANRKIFLYPENWVEPELRLPTRFRESLRELMAFICPNRGAEKNHKRTRRPAQRKGVCLLVTGKNRIGALADPVFARDRKSTRLNSSHTVISYAVFCLKKKTPPSTPRGGYPGQTR